MKKFIAVTLCMALLMFVFTSCIGEGNTDKTELIVFAAASLTESLTEIQQLYEAENPDVTLLFNFDSSGTLKTQIEEGADCDIFISAAPKQMNQLDIAADASINTAGLDYLLGDTRVDLLENKVVLVVSDGNPMEITSFESLAEKLGDGSILMAIGNGDVPVGQYTQKILASMSLEENDLNTKHVLTYGTNVKEVTTQVSEGIADCGIVYATDAFSAGLTVVDTATPEMCGQVIYPAAVLNVSKNVDGAKKFMQFLSGDDASAVFEKIGFTALLKADE